jgi:hypothetical protein
MPAMAPESTVMDETHKVAVTRLGDRIRVGGTAQLSGFDLSLEAGGARPWSSWCPISSTAATSPGPSSGPACAR